MAPCWRKWDSPERTGRRETEQDGRDVQAYTPHLLKSVTQGFCGGVGWSKYLVLSVARHVVPLPFPHTKISSFPGQTYKFKIGVGLTVTTQSVSSPLVLWVSNFSAHWSHPESSLKHPLSTLRISESRWTPRVCHFQVPRRSCCCRPEEHSLNTTDLVWLLRDGPGEASLLSAVSQAWRHVPPVPPQSPQAGPSWCLGWATLSKIRDRDTRLWLAGYISFFVCFCFCHRTLFAVEETGIAVWW